MRKRILILGVVLALVPLSLSASAHSLAELDEWHEGIEAQLPGLTPEIVAEISDVMDRHPWYVPKAFRPVPAPPTASSPSPSPKPKPTIPWNIGAGVEQWRGLVATYFPAGEVERALCIMTFESGGNPNAYNSSTATGLMQVKAFWAESFGYVPNDLFVPEINIKVAAGIQATATGWMHWAPYKRGECR